MYLHIPESSDGVTQAGVDSDIHTYINHPASFVAVRSLLLMSDQIYVWLCPSAANTWVVGRLIGLLGRIGPEVRKRELFYGFRQLPESRLLKFIRRQLEAVVIPDFTKYAGWNTLWPL